jgi:ABC-type branched-subunit amino acid transport system substrate-binding protein
MKRLRLLVVILALGLVAAACGTSDETTTTTAGQATTTTAGQATTTTGAPGAGVKTGIGVDADTMTIRLGALHDLTGPVFSPLVVDINDAMQIYYDNLNANGGIDGWMIEYVPEDTQYDVDTHLEKYEKLRDNVLAITASTGSPTSVAALPKLMEDNMTFIPLSWYSGWGIPEFDGGLALEQNTNYCIEAMNILEFINGMGGAKIALATFPGDYGQDAAAGVKLAAEFYGMEIVYDGEAKVVPNGDNPEVIAGIVGSGADWVFLTTNPTTAAILLGGSFGAGFTGLWTGSVPSYDFRLLDSPAAPLFDQVWYQSAYNVPWGSDAPGQVEMAEILKAVEPGKRPSDAFIIGWNEAKTMHTVLARAIANGDLTRAGVQVAVSQTTSVDFGGTAPNQNYSGTPDEYVTRQTAIFDPDLATYMAAGGAEQTISQDDATTGSLVAKDFFVSEAAKDFEFSAPCYEL